MEKYPWGLLTKNLKPQTSAVRKRKRHSRPRFRFVTTGAYRAPSSLWLGLELAFSPKHAHGLEHAHPADLAGAEISPSGLGIHFPRLDADISLPALLEGFLGTKRWIAAQIRKIGGATKSEAKTAAARENGKLGERPKKKKELVAA